MIETAVVILNWNGIKFLKLFLDNVISYSEDLSTKVFVIDNNSTDESIEFLKSKLPIERIIQLENNYGFAGGYNEGLKQIEATFYILLNSDVEVTPNWVLPLIDTLKSSNNIAACMPKLKSFYNKDYFEYAGAAGGYIDKYGYPFCRGRLFSSIEKDFGQYEQIEEVLWCTGAALCIKAEVFKNLNGFDVDFFAHMEEIDLCWRIKNMGFSLKYVPKSTVYHVGGGTLSKENSFKTYLNFRNNLFLLYKNLPKNILNRIIFYRKILDGIAFVNFICTGKIKNAFAIIKAHKDFYKNLSKLKSKRQIIDANTKIVIQKEHIQKNIILEYFILRRKTIHF